MLLLYVVVNCLQYSTQRHPHLVGAVLGPSGRVVSVVLHASSGSSAFGSRGSHSAGEELTLGARLAEPTCPQKEAELSNCHLGHTRSSRRLLLRFLVAVTCLALAQGYIRGARALAPCSKRASECAAVLSLKRLRQCLHLARQRPFDRLHSLQSEV
jgi:hypothetical protein